MKRSLLNYIFSIYKYSKDKLFIGQFLLLISLLLCTTIGKAQTTIAALPVSDGTVGYYIYSGSIGSGNYIQQLNTSTYADGQNLSVGSLPANNELAQWTVVALSGSTYIVNVYNGFRLSLSSSTVTSCKTTINSSDANIAITLSHTAGASTITAVNGANTLNLVFVSIAKSSSAQRVVILSPNYPGSNVDYAYDENAATASGTPGNGTTDADEHRFLVSATSAATAQTTPNYTWLETNNGTATLGTNRSYVNLGTNRYLPFFDKGLDQGGGNYFSSTGNDNRVECMPPAFYNSTNSEGDSRSSDTAWNVLVASESDSYGTYTGSGATGQFRLRTLTTQYGLSGANVSLCSEFYGTNSNEIYNNSSSSTNWGSIWWTVTEVAVKPIASVQAASTVTNTTATLNGSVDWAGGVAASVTARGFYYSTSSTFDPTISLAGATQVTAGSGTGSFSGNLTGLSTGTTYYYYAYATNSAGTKYSSGISFSTVAATITTGTVSGSPFCATASVSVPFTFTGSLTSFTAQLSDASGSFAAPVNIGTGTVSPISATLSNATNGTLYRIRVVSSSPVAIGTDNGTNLTVTGPTITLSSGSSITNVCPSVAITNIVYGLGGTATGASISWSPSAPAGISYNSGTYTISGTPTTQGAYTYTLTTSGGSCSAVTTTGIIGVGQTALLTSAAGTNTQTACQNTAITNITYYVGAATGASIAWSPTPIGISGNYSSGTYTISGAAIQSGTYNYTITTSGACGSPTTASGSITVNNGPSLYTYASNPSLLYLFTNNSTLTNNGVDAWGNASLAGGATQTTDRFGNTNSAYSFNGTSNYIVNSTAITPTYISYSEGIWFKTSTAGGIMMGLNSSSNGTGSSYDHIVYMDNSGNVYFGVWNGASHTTVGTSGTNYADGKWHFAAATISSSNGERLYIDGLLSASNPGYTSVASSSTEQYLLIGYGNLSGWTERPLPSSYYFNGSLDDAVVYNGTELTSAQVTAMSGNTAANGISACIGSASVVNVTSYSLSTGTYTVTYNVTGTNPISLTTASMSFTAGSPGTGSFTTISPTTNAGSTNVVNITGLAINGCTSNVSISTPLLTNNPLDAGKNDTISCSSTVALLATGGTSYTWSPGTGLSSTTIANPTASVIANSGSTLYTVSSTIPVTNAVVNGSFSSGNTGFTNTGYTYYTSNSSGFQGTYDIGTSAASFESVGFFSTCGDHTTGTGNMLLVDGAISSSQIVWTETVSVLPSTAYTFTYWVQSISGTSGGNPTQVSPASLQTAINGTTAGITGSNPVSAPSTAACGNWTQVTQTWTSGASTTFATLAITDLNTVALGNDFALDDISFIPIPAVNCTLTDTMRVFYAGSNPTITLSSATGTNNQTVCSLTTPITNITYATGGGATGAGIVWSPSAPSGISNSFNAGVYTISGTPTAGGAFTYTITTTGGICSPAATATGSLNIYANNTWLGVTNFHWNVGTNWSCGVPTYNSDVTIPNVSPTYPQPILDSNVTIHNIADSSGATLGLNAHTFTVNGALTGTGKFVSSSATSPSGLIFGGASTGTVLFTTTPGFLSILTLNDGANITLGSSTEVVSTGTVTVGSITGASLTSNGKLILNSDDNGSARVTQVPVSSGTSLSSIVGNVQVLTYIHSVNSSISTSRRAWRLLTAPITNLSASPTCTIYSSWQLGGVYVSGQGTMITAPASIATGGSGNGMDQGINGNYSMYTWNVSTQKLVATSNTKGGISGSNGSADNIGYFIFVRGDRTPNTVNLPWFATVNNTTLTSSGPLQLGDQAFTSASGALSGTINGLSVVGNPYACSIDFSELAGDKTGYATSYLSNITNRFYMWNSNLTGTQGVGGYVCIDDAGNTKTYTKSLGGSGSASAADISIQSGQAFFVMTTATGVSSLTFKELTKNNTNNFIYRPEDEQSTSTPDEFGATLSLLNSDSSTSLTDGVVAQFQNGYCDCVDYMDAPKFSNIDEMFSLVRYGKQLSIERRPVVVSTDTLFLNLAQMTQRSYQFGLTLNMPNHPGLGARLEDSYTALHTPLNMNGSNTVDFTIDGNAASIVQNRFMIVFGDLNIVPAYTNIEATKEGNTIVVQWAVSNDQQMIGYVLQKSTDGVNFFTVYTTAAQHLTGSYSWIDTNPVVGTDYYRVLSTDVLNEQSYSSVVSVPVISLNPSGISVFPNPIQDGQIGLAFNNMPAGTYDYRLMDEIGQEIESGSINYPGGNGVRYILLKKKISKGAYPLEVFEPDMSKIVINVIQ